MQSDAGRRPAGRSEVSASAAWALLLGASALYLLSANDADNDLWGQVLFGRAIVAAGGLIRHDPYSYTAVGAPWVDHEWLSQVLLYGTHALARGPGLVVLKTAVGIATFAALIAVVRRRSASPWVWGPSALLAVAALARGFAIRPQIFTYLLFAVLLGVLDRNDPSQRGRDGHARGPRLVFFVAPLMLLWVNLHGGFVLGLVALALYAAAAWLPGARSDRRGLMIALAVAVVASAANPYGWRLLGYVANELTFGHPITEWQPARLGDPGLGTFFAMLVLLVATLPFSRWRERPWEVALALATGVMALRHQRHTPVFALAAAAPLAAQLDGVARWWSGRYAARLSPSAQGLLVAAMMALAAGQVILQGARLVGDRFQVVFDPGDYPVAAVRALAAAEAGPLNLAVPLDWGEYVLWHLSPGVKVSLDGRFATVYPQAVVADNFAFFAGDLGWERLIVDYPTNAALVPRASPCPIRARTGWQRVYGDAVADVYVRNDVAARIDLPGKVLAGGAGVFP